MILVGDKTGSKSELTDEAIAGLERVPYCAGIRCIKAVGIALELQDQSPDGWVKVEVAHKVGEACLSCLEMDVQPLGTVYDQAEVDKILAEDQEVTLS